MTCLEILADFVAEYSLDAQSDDFTLTGSTGNKIGRLAVVCKIKDILLLPFKNNKLEIFNF